VRALRGAAVKDKMRGRLMADALSALLYFARPGPFTIDECAASLEMSRRRAYRWIRVGVDFGLVVPRHETKREGWLRTGALQQVAADHLFAPHGPARAARSLGHEG
jgi:hypothetical protein